MKNTKLLTVTVLLCLSTTAGAGPIIGAYEWREVVDTAGLTPTELASIYDTSTGQLTPPTTSLGGIDFAGWTWASHQEVRDLFSALTPFEINATNPNAEEYDSAWAPAIIDSDGAGADEGLFQASYIGTNSAVLYGVTRDFHDFGGSQGVRVRSAAVFDWNTGASQADKVSTSIAVSPTNDYRGFWMYRSATVAEPVPAPAPAVLLASGLLLGWLTRRQDR